MINHSATQTGWQGRRVLVTGGASGIGLATAMLLSDWGARVVIVDRAKVALDPAARGNAIAIQADLAQLDGIAAAVGRAADAVGGIDRVVNCAGISARAAVPDLTLDQWQHVLAVNLTAPFLVCQAALPFLRQAAAAAIVNVASAVGLMPIKGSDAAYTASKAGLIGLTKVLAAEFAPHVRVNAVCPGLTDTPLMAGAIADVNERGLPRSSSRYLLERSASAREVAEAICFLLGEGASFVTGTSLAVDGGRTFH